MLVLQPTISFGDNIVSHTLLSTINKQFFVYHTLLSTIKKPVLKPVALVVLSSNLVFYS